MPPRWRAAPRSSPARASPRSARRSMPSRAAGHDRCRWRDRPRGPRLAARWRAAPASRPRHAAAPGPKPAARQHCIGFGFAIRREDRSPPRLILSQTSSANVSVGRARSQDHRHGAQIAIQCPSLGGDATLMAPMIEWELPSSVMLKRRLQLSGSVVTTTNPHCKGGASASDF
jgi:hypothetical protein